MRNRKFAAGWCDFGGICRARRSLRIYWNKEGCPRILYFYRGIAYWLLSFWLLDCLIVMRDYYFHKLRLSINQRTHSFQAPLLPELELLLAVHPVAAVTVGLVLWLPAAAEGYSVPGFVHAAICRFNGDTASNPKGTFTTFLFVVNKYNRWFKFFFKGFACLLVPQDQPSRRADHGFFYGGLSGFRVVWFLYEIPYSARPLAETRMIAELVGIGEF